MICKRSESSVNCRMDQINEYMMYFCGMFEKSLDGIVLAWIC